MHLFEWPTGVDINKSPLPNLIENIQSIETGSTEELRLGQERQLTELDSWFVKESAYYQTRKEQGGLAGQSLTLNTLQQLPILTRRELQDAGESLFCKPPMSHLPVSTTSTSGSSGEPVIVQRTNISQLFWLAYTMRDNIWWKRDFTLPLAAVRANLPQEVVNLPDWGPPARLLHETGPSLGLSMRLDIKKQLALLSKLRPGYLLTYPNHLREILRHRKYWKKAFSRIKQIRTLGESLSLDLRKQVNQVLGVKVVDLYSSQEVGVIAIQCPESGLYHIMAENLIVEIINEQGEACKPGQAGKVVVTDLHNFATPLIRYDIGDYAEVGKECSCGRCLPTLKQIYGRSRNMVHYPDGSRRWPLLGFQKYRKIAPVIQYQVIQRDLHNLELRLVVSKPLSAKQETALKEALSNSIGYPFEVRLVYFDREIPRSRGGKFEEFLCEISNG